MSGPLDAFHPLVAGWFRERFGAPTEPQRIGWPRIGAGEDVLIVSHKATIRLLLSSLLGFDPRRYRDTLDQNPAALNIVDFKSAVSARLSLFNDTSHYAATGWAIPSVPTARLSKAWSDPPRKG